jgi:hypothetical protein
LSSRTNGSILNGDCRFSADSGFQFPDQYPAGGSYQNGGYQSGPAGYYGKGGYQYQNGYSGSDDGTRYARRHSGPYTTDEWGNRRYYNPRNGDGYHRYGSTQGGYSRTDAYRGDDDQGENDPPGWHHGRKRGWRGHSVPPGQWRHGWR